jgi:hypothetical protein
MTTGRMFLMIAGTAVLPFFGGLFSCSSEPEIEIEPVMTLYDKPLSTIKKVIEGRWQWYVSYGGFAGISYPDNTFVEFREDRYTIEYEDGSQRTVHFTWKKLLIADREYRTYVMWNREENRGGWYFDSIANDTLHIGIDVPPNTFDFISGHAFVRAK